MGGGNSDVTPILSTIVAEGPPDFLFYPVFTEICYLLTKQARDISDLDYTAFAAGDGCFSDAAAELLGDAGDLMYFSAPDVGYAGSAYDEFVAYYRSKYDVSSPISVFHAHAFDAANMILTCIEEIAQVGEDGSMLIGRQAMRDCLYATSGFAGLTGTLTCNQYGDCGDPKITISELENGTYYLIYP